MEVEDQVFQNSVERRIAYLTKIEEHLFDNYDRCVKNKDEGDVNNDGQYDSINIGSSGNPKLVCVNKCCSTDEREKMIALPSIKMYSHGVMKT